MGDDMDSATTNTPEPPPADDGWEYTPSPPEGGGFGPPPWPPQYSWTPAPRRRRFVRPAALSVVATAAIAGVSSAIAIGLNSVPTRTSTASTVPATSPAAASSSTASLAQVDQAVVDIAATLAGGQGKVAGTGMVI